MTKAPYPLHSRSCYCNDITYCL